MVKNVKKAVALFGHAGKSGAAVASFKAFGKVLDDRSDDVAMIAAELLGRMEEEQALDTLRRFATRRKKVLAKDPGLQEEVLRAIGRHRSPKSTSLLIKGAFEGGRSDGGGAASEWGVHRPARLARGHHQLRGA